jgi:hypothetical protein
VANQTKSSNPRSRRSFLLGLAAATALPELPAVAGATVEPANAAGQQPSQTSHSADVDALTGIVRLRYGEYLQSADAAVLQRGLDRLLRNAEEVLKVNIRNSDGPDCLFHPDGL